jgi:hypothetical protein
MQRLMHFLSAGAATDRDVDIICNSAPVFRDDFVHIGITVDYEGANVQGLYRVFKVA